MASTASGIALAQLITIFMLALITVMPNIEIHGLSFKLIPITSLFPKNLTLEEKHYKLVKISTTRADFHVQPKQHDYSALITSTNSTMIKSTNTITPSLSIRRRVPSGFYLTQVSIGSKPFSPYLVMDPGTDLTWVQCQGCTNCFPVRGTGNFKFQESQSYRKLPCNHPLCVPKICTADRLYCRYSNRYLTSSGNGFLSTETFTFPYSTTNQTTKYSSLVFGCGIDNRNAPFNAPDNVIAGVFGLGLTQHSILHQLQNQTKRRFSYCLTTSDWPTLLHFGDNASMKPRQSGIQTTPLVSNSPTLRYYVSMLGISIDNKRLVIDPNVFKLKPMYKGGFVVDSGSPYSFLVEGAYNILREEMIQYIAAHYTGLRPVRRGLGKFDLCYNLTTTRPGGYSFPSLTYHLNRANYFMKPDVVFQDFGTVRCLAMMVNKDDGPTILGAFQQTNYRFLFDASESTMSLSFAPEICV
ncbi:Aspartic peptidase [Trema orientale]|uniref:Aspartic peptidase n=1 Tax=Trema orientale TaxID=63057 RepID=A0A2P5D8B7_TREOI|nr:Aspartic peptidase [Trema orientale]